MSEIKELQELISAFSAYREVLTPLTENLKAVADYYESIKSDVQRLDKTFSGETKAQLDKIYSSVSAQARSSQELIAKIDNFSRSGEKYEQAIADVTAKFASMEDRLKTIDEIERNAELQLQKLDAIVNEKRTNYNVKDLQKSLDVYNKNVERISEYINKDVAAVLADNGRKIDQIRKENEALSSALSEQNKTVKELIDAFRVTTDVLNKTVEGNKVNEEYIFSVLDKWAASRKVKIKK